MNGEQTQMGEKPVAQPVDAATAAVAAGEVVLPGAFAQPERGSTAMEKIDLTQSIPARAFKLDEAAIEVIRELKCPGATKTEVAWFLYQCHALGLNPLLPGQISFVAYNNKRGERQHFVMVEIGGGRALAQRTGRYRQGDPPVIEWQEKGGLPEAVTISLYEKQGREWVRHERRFLWSEFRLFHGRDMWRDNPAVMFPKAAEAAMLRFYFPDALAGIYTPEEIDAPDVAGLMASAKPTKTIAQRVNELLGRAARAYKDLGYEKPRALAVDLAKQTAPEHAGSETWGEAELAAFAAAVERIGPPPTGDA